MSSMRRTTYDWNDELRQSLKELYVTFNVPSDQINSNTSLKKDFHKKFASKTGATCSPDELCREMIRMRKQKALPRIRS